jgi:hypothetical protein
VSRRATPRPDRPQPPTPRVKVWLETGGSYAFGFGIAEILQADDSRLGETGVPVKVVVQGQPVFVCCPACVRAAQKDPGRTLGRVEELKAKAAANPEG